MTDSTNGLKKVQIGSQNVGVTNLRSVLTESPACLDSLSILHREAVQKCICTELT